MPGLDFITVIQKLGTWFNKKLNDDQLDMWYEKLHHIPIVALKDIIDQLTSSEKYMPTIDHINILWSQWKYDHPKLVANEYEEQACNECEGTGVITCWYVPEDIKGYIVDGKPHTGYGRKEMACALCENWKRQFPIKGEGRPKNFWTKDQIQAQGWQLSNPDKQLDEIPF